MKDTNTEHSGPPPAVGAPVERPVRPHRIPTRGEVAALMKRCQIGVGGRNALDNAHSIMADCYGTLGLLMMCVEFYRARAMCGCGDEFTAHDPGTCGACVAGMTCAQAGTLGPNASLSGGRRPSA